MAEYRTNYVVQAIADVENLERSFQGIILALENFQRKLQTLNLQATVRVKVADGELQAVKSQVASIGEQLNVQAHVGFSPQATISELERHIENVTRRVGRSPLAIPVSFGDKNTWRSYNEMLAKVSRSIERQSKLLDDLGQRGVKNLNAVTDSARTLNNVLRDTTNLINNATGGFDRLRKDVDKVVNRAVNRAARGAAGTKQSFPLTMKDLTPADWFAIYGMPQEPFYLDTYGYMTPVNVRSQQVSYRMRRASIARQIADYAEVPFEPFDFQKHFKTDQLVAIQNRIKALAQTAKQLGTSMYDTIQVYDDYGNRLGQFAVLADRAGRVTLNFERSLSDLFRTMFYRMGVWAIATAGVYMFINGIRDAIGYVRELSERFIYLQIVADGLDFEKIVRNVEQLSTAHMAPMDEAVNIAYQFTKVFNDEEEAIKATELALRAFNISGLEYKESAELIISAIRQYNMNMAEAYQLMDQWAALARRGTVDFKELGEAFSRTAASAKGVGVSARELSILIETVGTATGLGGSEVGNFIKFISEHYGDAETIRALESVGISVYKVNGELRNMFDVIVDLSQKWKELPQGVQQYISNTWASYRQGSLFRGLVQSLNLILDYHNASLKSAGEAAYQEKQVLASLQGQVRQLGAEYTVLVSKIETSGLADFFAMLLRPINALLNAINTIPGGFNALLGFVSAIVTRMAYKFYEGMGVIAKSLRDLEKGISSIPEAINLQAIESQKAFNIIGRNVDALIEKFKAEEAAIRSATEALASQQAVVSRQNVPAGRNIYMGEGVPLTRRASGRQDERLPMNAVERATERLEKAAKLREDRERWLAREVSGPVINVAPALMGRRGEELRFGFVYLGQGVLLDARKTTNTIEEVTEKLEELKKLSAIEQATKKLENIASGRIPLLSSNYRYIEGIPILPKGVSAEESLIIRRSPTVEPSIVVPHVPTPRGAKEELPQVVVSPKAGYRPDITAEVAARLERIRDNWELTNIERATKILEALRVEPKTSIDLATEKLESIKATVKEPTIIVPGVPAAKQPYGLPYIDAIREFREQIAKDRRFIEFPKTVQALQEAFDKLGKTMVILPTVFNRTAQALMGIRTMIDALKVSIRGLLATIPEILLLSVAFSAVYSGIEAIGKKFREWQVDKAYEPIAKKEFGALTESELRETYERYWTLREEGAQRGLTRGEELLLEELINKQIEGTLTREEEARLVELQEKQEAQGEFEEMERRLKAIRFYHPSYGMTSLAQERDFEKWREQWQRFGGGQVVGEKGEEGKVAARVSPAPPEDITRIETNINKAVSRISEEFNNLKTVVDAVRNSYMDLGISMEYVSTVTGLMSQLQSKAIESYESIQERIGYVNTQLEENRKILENYRNAFKDEAALYDQVLSGQKSLEDIRKAGYSEERFKEYETLVSNVERLEALQSSLQRSSLEYVTTLMEIQQAQLQLVLSGTKYAGVWESIQNRIKLVKQAISELRVISVSPAVDQRLASVGTQVFGRGWDYTSFLQSRISSNIEKLWNTYISLEESIALYGDDQEKLAQAIEEARLGELGAQMKKAVTDPLIEQSDKLIQSQDKLTEATDRLTGAIEKATSGGLGYGDFRVQAESGGTTEGNYKHLVPFGDTSDVRGILEEAARKYNVPLGVLLATVERESGFRPEAVGDHGSSIGLGQINLNVKRNWDILRQVAAQYGVTEVKTREQAISLLKDPRINAEVTAIRIQQDLAAAGGDLVGFLKRYVGAGIPSSEIQARMNLFAKYGVIPSSALTNWAGNIQQEVKASGEEAKKQAQNVLNTIAQEIERLRNSYLGLPDAISQTLNVLKELEDIIPGQVPEITDIYRQGINKIVNDVQKIPALLNNQLINAIRKLANVYYEAAKKQIFEEFSERRRVSIRLAQINENLARKRSEELKDVIDQLIKLAYEVPASQLGDLIKQIAQLNKEYYALRKEEAWRDLFRQIGVQLTMSGLTGMPPNWAGIGSSILEMLQNLMLEFPQYASGLLRYIPQVQAFIDEVRYNSTIQLNELLNYLSRLGQAEYGSTVYNKLIENIKTTYEALYTLEEKVSDLRQVFETMAPEAPYAYRHLFDAEVRNFGRSLYVLGEQLRQANEKFQEIAPLSLEYFVALNDIVELHTKENELLSQRVDLTKKYFELTAEGLEEFVRTAGEVEEYRRLMLQAQIGRAVNLLQSGGYSGEDEYYALLDEIVSLEKQWLGLINERKDALAESFKLGIISLDEYLDRLEELDNKTYEARSSILEFHNNLTSGLRSAFARGLSDAFSGSMSYQEDFLANIKQSVGGLLAEAISDAIFEATGIGKQIDDLIASVTRSVFTGGQIDVAGFRSNLQGIIDILASYLPAYKDLLGGILETLKDQVFNAPSGFKIEPYVYEYMKGRGPEEIPGLRLPGEAGEGQVYPPLPPMPGTGEVSAGEAPAPPESPLQNIISNISVGLDGVNTVLSEHGTKFDKMISLLEAILGLLQVQVTVATIGYGQYVLQDGKSYMWSRELGRILGVSVDWDRVTSEVIIGGRRFKPAWVDEEGKSYVAIREVAQALGYNVEWNKKTHEITIKGNANLEQISRLTGVSVDNLRGLYNLNVSQLQTQHDVLNAILGIPNSLSQILQSSSYRSTVGSSYTSSLPTTSQPSAGTSSSATGGSTNKSSATTSVEYTTPNTTDSLFSKITKAISTNQYAAYIERTFPGGLIAYVNDLLRRAAEGKEPNIVERVQKELKKIGVAHRGGISEFEQLAILHRDEMVLPPLLTSRFIDFLARTDKIFAGQNTATPSSGNYNYFEVNLTIEGGANIDRATLNLIEEKISEGVAKALRQQERASRLTRLRHAGISY